MTRFRKADKQRGIATLLILMLVGIAISAAVLGTLRLLQGSQQQTTAMHGQTQAQLTAWTGVEMLMQYFTDLAAEGSDLGDLVEALETARDQQANLLGLNPTAVVTEVLPEGDDFRITVDITGRSGAAGSRAESASTVQVVYQLTPAGGGCIPQQSCSDVILDITGDLDFSGDVKFVNTSGEAYQINVDGNVTMGGLSLGGVDVLRSTKSIRFQGGSATDFEEMHANCDIQVSQGSFAINNVRATRNICLANTISSQNAVANGSIFVAGGNHGGLFAHANKPTGTAQCASGAITLCNIHPFNGWPFGNLTPEAGVRTAPTPTISSIHSRNEVHFNSSVTVGSISAEGNLRVTGCTPNWTSAIYGGSFTNNTSCSRTATAFGGPWVFPVPPVDTVEMTPEPFDANELRDIANYLYYRDGSNRSRVKIRGVEGIPDHTDDSNPVDVQQGGYYYRTANIVDPNNPGWTNRTVAGYACKNSNSPSISDDPGRVTPPSDAICLAQLGIANNITTFLPSFSSGKWVFNGVNHAPGIVFVEGNLDIAGGVYTNTFIATGNIHITTAGGAVFALNYAGPNGITAGGHTAIGVCNNSHYNLRPMDFCQGDSYNHDALGGYGNFVALAGSCPSSSPGSCTGTQYIGGDIRIDKQAFGLVKAGNFITTTGNAKIYGAVTSLGLGSTSVTRNTFGNSTEIITQNPPSDRYNHRNCSLIGCPVGGEGGNGGSGGGGFTASVLWTRYR